MLRRIIPSLVVLSLVLASVPLPARAISTQQEVEMGRQEDQQIVEGSVIETDPLLNAYVNDVANKLWLQVARKDLPYSIKIIKSPEINAFSTEGGYVYVYEGIVDFVHSDDELAAVIGHETGHIERRHEITLNSKAQALNILFGIASLFSPIIYNFGNLMEAGVIAKMQRADELQADRYGLQLMARAGYDPQAMLTMTRHLAVLESSHSDLLTKYLESHPAPGDRANHLLGYPELNPNDITIDERIVRAASDEERARYSIAAQEFNSILTTDPNAPEALLDLGQADLALGLTSKSQQTLAEAAQTGPPQARAQAASRILALRQMETQRISLTRPNLQSLRVQMQQAQTSQTIAANAIQARRTQGLDQISAVNQRLQALEYEVPNLGNTAPRPGSRTEAVIKNFTAMSRALNSAIEDATTSIKGVGTLETDKQSGLLKTNADILAQMQTPLGMTPIPADAITLLPSYPTMLAELNRADGDMQRSVDSARAALTILDESVGSLDALLKQLQNSETDFSGDLRVDDYKNLVPLMKTSMAQTDAAAIAASQSAQLYNMARTRQLSARITLLGLGTSPQRYATLQYALQHRFQMNGVSYSDMLHDGLTPGEVTDATILAADIQSTPGTIINEARTKHLSIVDEADARGMHAWPLEIFTHLVYMDYTDNPQKEMLRTTQVGGSV